MKLRIIPRVLTIIASAALLAHCAQYPAVDGRDTARALEQQEIRIGAAARQTVLQEYAALDHPALQAYVNEIGQRLARTSNRPGLPWHFTVLDSSDINAFALPGGDVYVTRGILTSLNSEAELAGVLGHEIGHVTARHGVRESAAANVAGLGSVLAPELNKGTPPMEQAWSAGYGAAHELEADRLGAQYLARAGYAPQALIDALGALKNQELFDAEAAITEGRAARRYHGSLELHPGSDARLKQAVGEAVRYSVEQPREGRNDYLQTIAGLAYGDSAEFGVIRKNALLHGKPGFGIEFPPGWRVQRQAERVAAFSPQNDALVEFRPGPQNAQTMDTLQHTLKFDSGVRFVGGNISGYPASFAAGALAGKPALAAAVLFGGTQYLIAGLSRDAAAYTRNRDAMKAAINSFHALNPAERAATRPRTIRLLTATAATRIAELAAQSPLGASAEAQLRLLNGLTPTGEPRPGQVLKVVE